MEETKETRSSIYDTCEPTETVVTVQRACRGVAPEGVPVLRGGVDPSHCYNHLEAYDPSNDP